MIIRFKKDSYKWSALAIIVLLALGCVALTNAQGRTETQGKEPTAFAKRGLDKTVRQAVLTISTCAEHDPRVGPALKSLEELDSDAAVKELTKYLDSEKNTIRRSAIYILWKGGFRDISAAVPALQQLCSHEEDITRGMAAIALGTANADSSFDALCSMTLKDPSNYARRCAAYALGLTGRTDARATLEKALKDSDPLVRNNAEAALKMLPEPTTMKMSQPVVIDTEPENYANDVSPQTGQLSVTFDQPMFDRSWSWVQWNYPFPEIVGDPYYDAKKTTCTLPVKLEPGRAYIVMINSESYTGFTNNQRIPAQPYALVFATTDRNGNPTPIPQDMLAKAKETNAIQSTQPYTQQFTAEITPDGTINFKTTLRTTNEGPEPITTTGFINSDFVDVTAMYDENGRPIKFTTVREGSHYRYNITLNEPVPPGKIMVYSHEGTMSGLIRPVPIRKNTYRYYMKHYPSAGRPTLRIETFLLPEGAELISTNPPDMKRSTRNGRIELHLEEIIPTGGSITTSFQYRLK